MGGGGGGGRDANYVHYILLNGSYSYDEVGDRVYSIKNGLRTCICTYCTTRKFCQKNQFYVNFYLGFKLSDYIGGTVIFITRVKICSTELNFLQS